MYSGYEALQEAIILRAVDDWRALYTGKNIEDVSFDEIREFFKSRWGKTLLGKASGNYILNKLELERIANEQVSAV